MRHVLSVRNGGMLSLGQLQADQTERLGSQEVVVLAVTGGDTVGLGYTSGDPCSCSETEVEIQQGG